jgi:hypothetical protein
MAWRGSTVLVAALAASAVAVPTAHAAEVSPMPEQTIAQPQAAPPPDLVALEQKMAQLQVNTIRFSSTEALDLDLGKSGFELPLLVGVDGESSNSPREAAFTAGIPGLAVVQGRLIGTTLYTREPHVAGEDGGRPWVSSEDKKLSEAAGAAPVDIGGDGGTGETFKGLIEAMNSGRSFIEVGPTIVEGQPVMEFTSLVEASKLPGMSSEAHKAVEKLHLATLEFGLFIAPDGLPVRIAITAPRGHTNFNITVDILALNFPLSVQAPPARETISRARLRKLRKRHDKGVARLIAHLRKSAARKRRHAHR